MSSLDFLHYTLSAAIIVIALAIIVFSVFLVIILQEIRKVVRTLSDTARGVKGVKDFLGRVIFQKKPTDE